MIGFHEAMQSQNVQNCFFQIALGDFLKRPILWCRPAEDCVLVSRDGVLARYGAPVLWE